MKLVRLLSRLLLGVLPLPFVAQAADAPAAKPSLCFVTEWCNGEQEDVPLVEELRKAGFIINNLGIQNLTPEIMQQHNALIFPEFPMTDALLTSNMAWQVNPALLEKLNPQLDAYVRNGGGLVMYGVCFFQTQLNGMAAMNRLLAPWGAETLYEQIYDPERQYHYKQIFTHEYSWTENLAKHSVTDGLKRIYFGADGYHGPTTCTFKLSPEWTAIVRGEASARSVPGNTISGGAPDFFIDKPGTYPAAPPLVAVREYGKGRLAVIGVTPQMAVFGARYAGYGNVLLDVGDGNRPSDFGKLQERLYRWAAEPAQKAGTPGGFVEKPRSYAINPDLEAKPVDWGKFEPGEPGPRAYRGLIGARTAAGGGAGTVAEYVTAAATAGLDFVVFADDFDRLGKAGWDELKKACQAASTEKTLAVPGFLYRDNVNAQWVAAGDFPFPPVDKLSTDGKKIINPMWWFDASLPLNAPIFVGKNPRPFWSYSIYAAMAVKTFQNGVLADDATDAYLDRQEIEDVLSPIVVDLLDAPARVAAAATHTTGVFAASLKAVGTAFTRNSGSSDRFFAGTGPAVTDWRSFNQTRATQGRWEPLPGTERASFQLAAASPVGLKNVRLMDGPHLLRRFAANGAKEFKTTVHLLHDRQRHLLVMAEDTAGNTVISGVYNTCDQLNVYRMCGDRGNTIDFSVIRTDYGRVFINGPIAPYQRKTTLFGFFPGYCDLSNKFAAPYVDGGLRPVSHQSVPSFRFKDRKSVEGTFASKMVHPLASRDVIIQQSDLVGWFDNPQANAWAPADPIKELSDFTASVRWLDFVKRYHDPGFTLVEGTITFLRDAELEPGHPLNPVLHRMQNGSTDLNTPAFSLVGAGPGGALAGLTSKDKPVVVNEPIAKGGFASLLPCLWGSGAVLILDPGYSISANFARLTASAEVGMDLGGQKVTKGQKLSYRLLAGRGVLGAESSDREWREFCRLMGLNGPPGYALTVSQGTVVGSAYVLDAEAADGGFCAVVGKAALPVRLPICVRGINPKWSAAIVNVKNGDYLPIGVIEAENKAYATWDTTVAATELYIGNLVRCDNPDLILTVTRTGNSWQVDVHNPGDAAVAATVRGAAKVTTLAGLNQKVEVAPGQSVVLARP